MDTIWTQLMMLEMLVPISSAVPETLVLMANISETALDVINDTGKPSDGIDQQL